MLEVKDLHVGYGQSQVIHGASFGAAKAEILAIMGRNGMGKTTLLKSLIGVISSKSGSVKVNRWVVFGEAHTITFCKLLHFQRMNSGKRSFQCSHE